MPRDLRGVERHGEALPRALGVPNNPYPLVALLRGSLDRRFYRPVDRVELVIRGDLLRDRSSVVLEDDEVPK